jgi:ubiquinone/menaquinone biosynthesis C-methylase UbiE
MDVEELKKVLGTEFSFLFDKINPILQYLDISRNARILDIGTGKGRMVIILAFNGYKVLTGEPESDISEYAKQNWLEDAKKVKLDNLITFKAFNAEKMPFEDNLFDAIFIQGALHHIDDMGSAFNECIRTIKEKGVICILEPSRNGIKIVRR